MDNPWVRPLHPSVLPAKWCGVTDLGGAAFVCCLVFLVCHKAMQLPLPTEAEWEKMEEGALVVSTAQRHSPLFDHMLSGSL